LTDVSHNLLKDFISLLQFLQNLLPKVPTNNKVRVN